MKDKDSRLSLFDSAKGIAMIGIVFIHLVQYNSLFTIDSYGYVISTAGLLGVELTYMINAYFYTASYNRRIIENHESNLRFLSRMILRLIPVYYFALIIYAISTYIARGTLGCSVLNIASHFLLLNGLKLEWWAGFMGGTGYIGILVLMWGIFSVYLKYIRSMKSSIWGAVIFCTLTYTIYALMLFINREHCIDSTGQWDAWLWYINRGCYSFSLGSVLYYVNKWGGLQVESLRWKWILTLSCLFMIAIRVFTQGSGFDGFAFALTWFFIIIINLNGSIKLIDNSIFSYLGKYSMEIFVTHIVLAYIIIYNQELLLPGWSTFVIIAFLTIVIAPLLHKLVHEPFMRIFNLK